MKNERLARAIGKIDDDLIYNAVDDVKARKKGAWLKWAAVAACLSVVIVAIFVISDAVSDSLALDKDERQASSADYPAMVMINGELYRDSGVVTFTDSFEEDGKIVSSCDKIPTDNNQSNFGIGYGYQYGEDDTIIVQLDDGWHIFILTGSNRNVEGLTEQEKMEIDPYYNAD